MKRASEELEAGRGELMRGLSKGRNEPHFPERHSELVDQYFRRALQESPTGRALFKEKCPIAFVAVGGYGRRELCLHSDIDILMLFGRRIPRTAKALSDEIFFPLWDLGFDVGYVVRTLTDCVKLARDDFQVLTSLLDARFLCGDSPLYLDMIGRLRDGVLRKKATAFAHHWLEDQAKIREATFGDASFLLAPNLKEGLGGLRDYHTILWLARLFFDLRAPRDLEYQGRLSHAEFQELEGHLEFIWRIRNDLHFLSGRKNDRLSFEFQKKIAERMGFRDQDDLAAVEEFMGRLHASMACIKSLHRSFLRTHLPRAARPVREAAPGGLRPGLRLEREALCFDGATAILARPLLLMEIFEESGRLGFPLSMEARRLVREFAYLVNDEYRGSAEALAGFFGIIESPRAHEVLDEMFATSMLDAFLPEFAKIRDRVQFDAYHIYPVGRHVLQTLGFLKSVGQQKDILFATIFKDVTDKRGLFLAALFHDIGKIGRDHALRGAQISRRILDRFRYPQKAADDILFLVRNHLLLAETATRRDLNDEKVVVQCARGIGSAERLKMLYLLTWADSSATGPRAWNDWTASLVRELFFKILHILENGELASADASRRVEETRREVRERLADPMDGALLDRLFEAMATRYLLERRPADILRDIEMVLKLEKKRVADAGPDLCMQARKDETDGCWELTFAARDRPGLFAHMAGVLALGNINILSARIYTWRDGTAVDLFKVTSPLDPLRAAETWRQVEENLRDSLSGKLSLVDCLGQKASPSILSAGYTPTHPPKVVVDNGTSDFFTLVEVFADDRIGLLYLITRTLFNLGLDIRIAKISTKGDQVADVFYVRDLEGQKLEEARMEETRETLLRQLG